MRSLLMCLVVIAMAACSPSKSQFIEKFEPAMMKFFCAPKGFTLSCYDVTEEQCLAVMKPALGKCLDQYKDQMPDKFDRESGAKIGELVGMCAGTAFEKELLATHKRTDPAPKCDDPSNQTHWPVPTP